MKIRGPWSVVRGPWSAPRIPHSGRCTPRSAFTLIEVAVASAILAMTLFAVLMICSQGLRTARALQQTHIDASSLAAWLSITNRLEEGSDSGNFNDLLGDAYPNATWQREITQVGTNGLFRVDFRVFYAIEKKPLESELSILLYRPDSIRRLGR
jgi:prepilin-type N-terminal cleavage/methylation domain-containing protein